MRVSATTAPGLKGITEPRADVGEAPVLVAGAAEARLDEEARRDVDGPAEARVAEARVAAEIEAAAEMRARHEIAREEVGRRERLREQDLAGEVGGTLLGAPGVLGGAADAQLRYEAHRLGGRRVAEIGRRHGACKQR